MSEGGLGAPVRHNIPWQEEDFYDREKLDLELRRVFDICHGCRRCFNLCDSFPKLFDLIDESESGELDTVASVDFVPVIDACTLCDICFVNKCPYVPPHEFNLDFPHLMLRARAIEAKEGKVSFVKQQLTKTDRNGKLASPVAPLVNWASKCGNSLTRPVMEQALGIHREAELPKYQGKTLQKQAADAPIVINKKAPAFGRKVALYATCSGNYNNTAIGMAARAILALNGVEVEIVYPECCGMPQFEHGDLSDVAAKAKRVSSALGEWIDRGYDIVSLVPSCTLMLKSEWPLLLPDDGAVSKLSSATSDISEYIVGISKKEGLSEGISPLEGNIAVHIACHARAQNVGFKAAELLRLIPEAKINVIEKCSGHGGSWGIMKENFETAHKVGKPAVRLAMEANPKYILSECPLARDHLVQGSERLTGVLPEIEQASHPVQLLAKAYGL